MKSSIAIKFLWLLACVCLSFHGLANNIVVSNISLTNRNTSTKTVRVNFNLNWDNSWRTTSAPFNWDAAWVFVKYRVGTTGEWKHATLATSGHTLPGIATSTQTDATGIFIYRSAAGSGNFNPTGIQLQWNYGIDGVANEARIFVRVFAIEMVYNQVGGFQAGSGAISNGEFRRANDVTATAPASTFTITGTLPTIQGNSSSSSPTSIAAYNNTSTDLTGTNTASLAAGFPTGFNAFYSMKYEISQQQYVEFLNTLTYSQQSARTATTPNSPAGTGALINPNDYRNGIDIQTPGTASTVLAIYACNLNDNTAYDESDDGQHIACNYLSWNDVSAYLDWAALRPMTELEYEKSCRGNQTPVASEYPWGSISATALSGISNPALTDEAPSNAGANITFNNVYSIGPTRTGIFANSGTNRSQSGAGYYGNMELGGNLWERVITLGNSTGRAFSGNNGNGVISSAGTSDVSGWPIATGTGWKGGSFFSASSAATTSDRNQVVNGNNSRSFNVGGRGARTISSGIVTNGLVLWLDAGVTASYPESGTTWTDLSGNRNNGTLINGIGFNNTNGGSLSFDGVNDYASIENSPTLNFSSAVSISIWFNSGTNQNKVLYLKGRTDVDNYNPLLRSNGFYAWTGINGRAQYLPPVDFIVNNTWYNLTVTHTSGSNPQIYKNGILATGYTYTEGNGTFALGTNGNPVSINADIPRGTIETFNGRIAIIIAYPRSLNSAEVLQNFNAQKARFGL